MSDAGTPLFCDPGAVLVRELKKHNFSITSLAGANAVATFLSQVAREDEDFVFVGFLPKIENQIKNIISKYKSTDIVFYESPNRLLNTLEIIAKNRLNSKVAIARELTKVFEEVVEDSAENIIEYFKNNTLKGEIVGLVFRDSSNENIDVQDKISKLKAKGYSAKDISVIISQLYELNKNDIYQQCIKDN